MIYLLYGTDEFSINNEIKKLIDQNNITDLNKNTYDLENTSLYDIINDASTISFFSDKKVIICQNSYIFTGTTNKKSIEQNIDILEEYISNPNPNTILIFVVIKEKLDERKKIVKFIKKTGTVKEFNKLNDINKIIINMFENYKIENNTVNLLKSRVGTDLFMLKNEIDKIKLYKDDDYYITEEDINNLTTKNIDLDIFDFIEYIITRNKEKSIEIYREMIKRNEEPIKIIVMLANQIRIIYQTKELYKKGYSESDIAGIIGIHPYRIKLALSKAKTYNSELLLTYINDLADIDMNIKKGLIDKNLALELFILNM